MVLQAYITDAIVNINQAIKQYPVMTQIHVMLSGGKDSAVVADILLRHFKNTQFKTNLYALDTGLSADGWHDYLNKLGSFWNKEVTLIENQQPEWYAESVMKYGFPYTPASHMIVYRMLKERQIMKILRDTKEFYFDRVGFCTGTRRHESTKRINTPIVDRKGCNVIINPIVNWTDLAVHEYHQTYNIPPNPFYDTLGGSGDCYCNWGNFVDLETVKKYSPKLYEKLAPLNDYCLHEHGYGYADVPNDKNNLPDTLDNETDFPNLCAGCQRPKPKRDDVMDAFLTDRIKW